MKRRSSYKVTFFDRHGPEGALYLKIAAQGVTVFGISTAACLLRGASIPLTLLISTSLTLVATVGTYFIIRASGTAASTVYLGGNTTPYQDQFSQEQALVMQREYGKAADLFEHRIAMNPGDPRVLMAAADLYREHVRNPKRAAELYRQVQKLPEVASGQDVYVSNKLADLYLGPLKEPRRALVEFRRLMERYPGSVAAQHAKSALEKLKTDLMADGNEKPGTDQQGEASDYKVW